MIPSITIRIDNLIKAVEVVIAPAIKEDASLAQEQAALVLRHLRLIRDEWDSALIFEKQSLHEIHRLAALLVGNLAGGPSTVQALDTLKTALKSSSTTVTEKPEAVNREYCTIAAQVDAVIDAVHVDGTAAAREYLLEATLEFGDAQAIRERIWFQATGMDPDRAELGSFAEIFK